MPCDVRRTGTSYGAAAVSACTSTTIGRLPSIVGATADPGTPVRRSARNKRARVGHTDQPAGGHLEQPELVGGTEPVLRGAQQPQRVMPVALERQHRVDHVLEDARPGEAAVLGDVTDHHDGDAAPFGLDHQPVRARPHLHDAAGR